MEIVIDTGVFIRWESEGGGIDLGLWADFGTPAISVITQSELLVGVYRANTPERRDKRLQFVRAIISNTAILPVDSRVADVHARLVASLSLSGMSIDPHDNWIAATAVARDYALLTTNTSEFGRVTGLKVIDFSP